MKYVFSFLLLLIGHQFAVAQPWLENFNNGLPSGWLRYNLDNRTPATGVSFVNEAWVVRGKQTTQGAWIAGDSVIVSTSFYNPHGAADDWIVSPAFTVSNSNTWLHWDEHAFDYLTPESYEVRVSGTGNQPADFTTILYSTTSAAPGYATKAVSLTGYNGQTIRVAFRNNGNNNLLLGLDNIGTQILSNIDAAVDSVIFPKIHAGSNAVTVIMKNEGLQTINSLTMQYQVNANTPVVQTFTGLSLAPFAATPLSFSAPITSLPPGAMTLTVTVNQVNNTADQQAANNSRQVAFAVPSQTVAAHCLIEEFSSSTCHPCAEQNVWLDSLLLAIHANSDTASVNVIKYQMNYPAPGTDASYNAHSSQRYDYYRVFGLPDHFAGGKRQGAQNAAQLSAEIGNCKSAPAYVKLEGNYAYSNDSLFATAKITPYFTLTGDYSVHILFVDDHYTIPNTFTTQTEYYHVMRKMAESGNGYSVAGWTDNVPQTFQFRTGYTVGNVVQNSFNLWNPPGATSMIVFVQDNHTQEILQSGSFKAYSLGVHDASIAQHLAVAPNPAKEELTLHFSLTKPSRARISLMNGLGQVVYELPRMSFQSGVNRQVMRVASLPPGIYTLIFQTGNERKLVRVAVGL